MLLRAVALLILFVVEASLGACKTTERSDIKSDGSGPVGDPGALIKIDASGTVGVLLDEIPVTMRDRVAASLLAKDAAFWQARAKRQLALTTYRLSFRKNYYPNQGRQQLPLPPPAIFDIKLNGPARRATVDGHALVLVDYTLSTTLLSTFKSAIETEPELVAIGGKWQEPFVLPIDPELLVQRTGYACMDESEFPPNSVDTEDTEFFYDQECKVEAATSKDGCHRSQLPTLSCQDALAAKVGKVAMAIEFTRLAWDAALADKVRVGAVTNPSGSDLNAIREELAVNRVTYRYIPADSCALAEQCVTGSGWRRLLQFNASEKNLGAEPVHIGDVDYFIA